MAGMTLLVPDVGAGRAGAISKVGVIDEGLGTHEHADSSHVVEAVGAEGAHL